jgi:hypothetical protein
MLEKPFKAERDAMLATIRKLQTTIASPRDRDTVLPNTGGTEVVSIRARLRRAEKDLLEIDQFLGKDARAVPLPRVPWNLCVVVMDGGDKATLADAPFAEAKAFIEKYSRLTLNVNVLETKIAHDYNSHGYMLTAEIPQSYRDSLPVSHSFIFLYKTGTIPVPQYGSTLGPDRGIFSGGKWRSVAFIPFDSAGYVDRPYEGFPTQRAQIDTHEITNTVNCMTGIAPYFCTNIETGVTHYAHDWERERLQKLTDADYAKLLADKTW